MASIEDIIEDLTPDSGVLLVQTPALTHRLFIGDTEYSRAVKRVAIVVDSNDDQQRPEVVVTFSLDDVRYLSASNLDA